MEIFSGGNYNCWETAVADPFVVFSVAADVTSIRVYNDGGGGQNGNAAKQVAIYKGIFEKEEVITKDSAKWVNIGTFDYNNSCSDYVHNV